MRRIVLMFIVLAVVAVACGDDASSPSLTDLTQTTLPTGTTQQQTTITVDIGDGADATLIQGGGSAVVQIGDDVYEVPLEQCVILPDAVAVNGESDELAFGLFTGVGLSAVTNPNGSDPVSYVMGAPDFEVSGTQVTGGGEVSGIGATGFTDTVQLTIIVNC